LSLEIDVEKISEVLLADGWHKVSPVGDGRSSFGLEVYAFQQSPSQELPTPQPHAGQPTKAGQEHGSCCRSGARWTEADGSRVFCPATSILAVKYQGQQKTES
jgi:uncharacterized protein (DUF2237 family)